MAKKDYKIPAPSLNDRATIDLLAGLGVQVDPATGQVSGNPFQGEAATSDDPGNPGFEEVSRSITQDVSPLDRIEGEAETSRWKMVRPG